MHLQAAVVQIKWCSKFFKILLMQTHQPKSLLNGKKDICLLFSNQACVLKHSSAVVVTICMLLTQLAVSSI